MLRGALTQSDQIRMSCYCCIASVELAVRVLRVRHWFVAPKGRNPMVSSRLGRVTEVTEDA